MLQRLKRKIEKLREIKMRTNQLLNLLTLSILIHKVPTKPIDREEIIITPIDTKKSIYLEHIREAQLYHDTWKVTVGIEHGHLQNEIKLLILHTNQLAKRCDEINPCLSKQRIILQQERNRRLNQELISLRKFMGHVQKRGLLNAIGEGMKILFGTMTASDAEYYNNEFDKLREDNIKIAHLVKNQTTMLLHKIQDNLGTYKYIQQQTDKPNINFELLQNAMKEEIFNLEIDETFADYIFLYHDVSTTMQKLQEAIVDGKHGIVHPTILPPSELFEAMRNTTKFEKFPVPLKEEYYGILLDTSEISITLTNEKLIYNLRIPILEEDVYTLYRPIALPIYSYIQGYSVYNVEFEYLLLNKSHTEFIPINEEEKAQFKSVVNQYVIQRKHPNYLTSSSNACLIELLLKKNQECSQKYIKLQGTLFIQLSTNQDWIAITPKKEQIQ
nr:PREDICTED: uncharacterized protein LOC105663530 [Megachile rotundata]